ncbi:family 43 glycosylhydrolase [Amphibacillus sediminis]|uniref:family 43 glycosylhydrolase n=1 Tax=Amphibacillus sediminis TaxID=360185 RepID=UPI000A74F197|nr:glycoside hydrolase family 32 protein [Amphibacillus sediminis]
MKKFIWIAIAVCFIGGVIWVIQRWLFTSEMITKVYPRSKDSFVGDPMPYYNGSEFMIYYLEDLRDNQIGFHPFSLMTTTDFVNYKDYGEVIPFVNDHQDQELALGTGSIITDENGLYHAFYTGHNGSLSPKEAIMHATSQDGLEWEKHPEHTFFASSQYEADDFRDPYVFYEQESGEYWMLITARQNGTGVIAHYTSTDLETWNEQGVLFKNDFGNDSNLECPSLVFFKGKWYLAFSDQWDQRVVHYRVADHVHGPFEKPTGLDYWDSSGFYAGRLETDGEQLYVVGWIPTKEGHNDQHTYNWAGNLAVHELVKENNHLYPTIPTSVSKRVHTVPFSRQTIIEGDHLSFDPGEETTLYSGKVNLDEQTKKWAFQFNSEQDQSNLNIVFDTELNTVAFYNRPLDVAENYPPETEMPFNYSNQSDVEIKLVLEDDIVVLYLDNKVALSNRMYRAQGNQWAIISIEGNLAIEP